MASSATEGQLTGPHLYLFGEGWDQVLPPQPFLPRDRKVEPSISRAVATLSAECARVHELTVPDCLRRQLAGLGEGRTLYRYASRAPLERPLDCGHHLGCSVGEEVGGDGHAGDRDPADDREPNSDHRARLSLPSVVPRRGYAKMARPSTLGAPAARRRMGTCRDPRCGGHRPGRWGSPACRACSSRAGLPLRKVFQNEHLVGA